MGVCMLFVFDDYYTFDVDVCDDYYTFYVDVFDDSCILKCTISNMLYEENDYEGCQIYLSVIPLSHSLLCVYVGA